MPAYHIIDPDETLDFSVDWTAHLSGGDSIATSTWAIEPTGPNLSGASETDDVTTVFVDSCALGKLYRLTNDVVTSQGRTQQRSFDLRCMHR